MRTKKRLLYLGLDPSTYQTSESLTHFPLIKIIPYPLKNVEGVLKNFINFTHVLITSKSTIPLLIAYLNQLGFELSDWTNKKILAIGKSTARTLEKNQLIPDLIAQDETSEGIIKELDQIDLSQAHLFWPHSALSRSLIGDFFREKKLNFTDCILYNTVANDIESLPKIEEFDEIIFTSPSTVEAFLKFFDDFPKDKTLTAIGPITEQYLKKALT